MKIEIDEEGNNRILLIGLEFVEPMFSGNGILTQSVVRGLMHVGYDVTVICARPENTPHTVSEFLDTSKLHVLSVPVPEKRWRRLDRKSAWKELSDKIPNNCEVLERSFRYVFCVDWSAVPTYRSIINRLRGTPEMILLVFRVFSRSRELHTSEEDTDFYCAREKEAVSLASSTFVLSRVDQRELTTLCEREPKDTFHILVPPLRQDIHDLSLNKRNCVRKYLLCNVRLAPEKNAILFARVVAALTLNGTLEKFHLTPVMIGSSCDPFYAAEVRSILPKTTIVRDTFIPPHEMLEFYRQTVLMIHPPLYDAYGMTIAEAAAVSTPSIIHHNHIGATSLFRKGEIFTVDFTQMDIAVARIIEILNAPKELLGVGEKAQRRALSWTTIDYAHKLHNTLQ